jgi:hypothetical protein
LKQSASSAVGTSAAAGKNSANRLERICGRNQTAAGIRMPPISTPSSSVTRGILSKMSQVLCRLVSSSTLNAAQYSGVPWKKRWPQLISSPAMKRLESAAMIVTASTRGRLRTKGRNRSRTAMANAAIMMRNWLNSSTPYPSGMIHAL